MPSEKPSRPTSKPKDQFAVDRRSFLATGASLASASAFSAIWSPAALAARKGQLVADPKKVIDLPPGFRYQILATSGMRMSDGYSYAGRPDGMGCFEYGKDWVLMVNHELSPQKDAISPYLSKAGPAKEAYDPKGIGGVSRLVIDPKTLAIKHSNLALVGTHRNCAGGVSPWGWLSCEENVSQDHGYVFACPIDQDQLQAAKIIRGYGRFHHEAVAIRPENYYAYLTEDRGDSCIYRFVPDSKAEPFRGELQALKIPGKPRLQLAELTKLGASFKADWIPLQKTDAPKDDLRERAQSKGAAILSRGEGIWYADEGRVVIVSTSGGPAGAGQVFELQDSLDGSSSVLKLVAQSQDKESLDSPDNITVAPWGDLVVAEDGGQVPHIRVINNRGEIFDLAKNSRGYGEFAGVCFSPDGSTLFVNLQVQGQTIAIQGPFREYLAKAQANPNV